jgi:hypothetical protein
MGVRYSLIAESVSENRVRTLAYWQVDKLVLNVEYDLPGTPCEDVVRGSLHHHPSGVAGKNSRWTPLRWIWGSKAIWGVPLVAPASISEPLLNLG